jgi:hypothetical protein
VDEKYQTIPFPFEEIAAPGFNMEYDWTVEDLEGYINTWSATQKFIHANHFNPVVKLIQDVRPLWNENKMKVRFPLHVRIGRISNN